MKKIIYLGLSLLIMLTGIIFTGCDEKVDYSLSLSGPAIKNEEISLVLGEDSEELIVTINNFSNRISERLSFDFYEDIAIIKNEKYLGNGKTSVVISPMVRGNTTLRISSYQNSVWTTIPIKITEGLESVSLKSESLVYAVKGDKLYIKDGVNAPKPFTLNTENFEFIPQTSTQKGLNFYYQKDASTKIYIASSTIDISKEGEISFLTTDNEPVSFNVTNKFNIFVESKVENTISTVFEVTVVEGFDQSEINIYQSELGDTKKTNLYDETQQKHIFPKFIRNNIDKSIQYFKISLPDNASVRVSSKNKGFNCEVIDYIEIDGVVYAEFSVQALKNCNDTLILELYRNDYISYTQTIECEISSCEVATGILLNDVLNEITYILYNGRSQATAQNFNLTLFPEQSKLNENIEFEVNFYLNYNEPTQEKIEDTLELSAMLGLMAGGKNLFTNDLTLEDISSNLSIWVSNLKASYANLAIEFICKTIIDEEEYLAKNVLKISVKEGASEFFVKEGYEINKYTGAPVLFIEKGQTINFSDFDVKSPSGVASSQIYIGDMQLSCDDASKLVCDIEQVYNTAAVAEIKITAKNVGSSLWTIKLDSGAQLKLEIQVVDLFKEDDFVLYLGASDPNIAEIAFDGINGSISEFTIKNSDYSELSSSSDKVTLMTRIDAFAKAEVLERVYSWERAVVDEDNVSIFVNENNSGNITLSIKDLTTSDGETIKLNIKTGRLDNFKLVEGEIFEYEFVVYYTPAISTFTMQATKDVVYPKDEIGYHAQVKGLHESEMELTISPQYYTDSKIYDLIKSNIVWSFSQSYMSNYLYKTVSETKTDDNGYTFYVYDIEGYGKFDTEKMLFTFNGNSSNISPRIYIYAEYREYSTIYSDYVSIQLESYTKVNQLSFKNSTSDIYIDAIKTEFTLLPLLTPVDANDKSYVALYVDDKDSEGNGTVDVIISEDYSKITLKYNGSGGGKGNLLIIPTTSFTGENTYGYFVSVPVSIGDGTKANPLRINTSEDLLSINTEEGLKKHYVIYGEIDMGYKSFVPMGEFSGSIVGHNGALIKGINISQSLNNSAGLFTKIKTENVSDIALSNISFEGKITLNRSATTNFGLICGINESTLVNVHATLVSSETLYYDDTTSGGEIYGLGFISGLNKGVIKVGKLNDVYPSITTLATTAKGYNLKLNQMSAISAGNSFYVGGVTGINEGSVIFESADKIYNNFGLTTSLNIETAFVVGSIAGINMNGALISGVVSTGRLVSENHIGGIVGINNGEIKDCISRCFVYSKGNDEAYVGGVAGKNTSVIKNTNVEATYDGSYVLTDIVNNALISKKFSGITISNSYINPITDNLTTGCENNNCYSYNSSLINIIALDTSGNYKKVDNSYNYPDNKFTDESDDIDLPSILASKLLYYYKAKEDVTRFENGDIRYNQNILDKYKNTQVCPYEELLTDVNYESKNYNILTIGTNGEFIINGVGQVQLIAKSSLDASKVTTATIYVTNYIDGYAIFVGSDKSSYPIYSGSQLLVFKNKPVNIFTKLYASDYEYQTGVFIELVEPSNEFVKVIISASEDDIVNITSNSTNTVISAGANNGEVELTAKVIYKSSEVIDIDAKNIHEAGEYKISALYTRGIEEINLDKQGMIIYPSITPEINVTIKTNDLFNIDLTPKNSDDFIKDIDIRLVDTVNSQIKFTQEIDYINKIIYFKHLSNNIFKINYSTIYNNTGADFENIIFNFEIELLDKTYGSDYAFIFSSKLSSEIVNTFYLNYENQPITSLVVNTYAQKDGNTVYTNYIEPGKTTNNMTLFVNPIYADYDYIDILNSEENYENNAQVLFTYDSEFKNYSFLSNGIRIYKTNSAYHKLKYTISSLAINNSKVRLNVNAYKVGLDAPVYTTSKILTVKQLAEVKVSVANKNYEEIYLAKGNRYLLEVTAGKYSSDQVVVYSGDNSKARVVKQGELYYLDILPTAEIGELSIYSYGFSMVDGKEIQSQLYELKVNIMNFVISNDRLENEFEYFQTFVGAEKNLVEELIEGLNLEYNPSVQSAKLAVQDFKEEVKDKADVIVMLYDEINDTYNEFKFATSVYNNEYFDLYVNGDGEVIYKALKSYSSSVPMYKFKLSFKYSYLNGRVSCGSSGSNANIEKYVEIISRSSMENPLPIRDINDLYSMRENAHYILLNDITLPNNFTPIKTEIASFNGNGYKIVMGGYSVSELSLNGESSAVNSIAYVGLFESITLNAVIKNVEVYISGTANISIDKHSNSATYVGVLAGVNYGSVTNCKVSGDIGAGVKVNIIDSTSELSAACYVGGLVGHNNGYITNSNYNINISANTNLAGFVGLNSNHIASSYVKNSYIQNISAGVNTTNKTAGFVVENTGMIFTSFISGISSNNFYSNNQATQVIGKQEAAGFVFYNKKSIMDCYSDIPTYAQSNTSGFVGNNSGTIEGSFTTSKLKDNSQASFNFFNVNTGNITRSYYCTDINKDIYEYGQNVTVKGLSTLEFRNPESFYKYSIASKDDSFKKEKIWFYGNTNASGYSIVDKEFNYEGEKYFISGRPELVSANVEVKTRMLLDYVDIDSVTNEEIYIYKVAEGYQAEGGEFNPFTISSAAQLEDLMISRSIRSTNRQFYNFNNFRLINSITYGESQPSISSMYKIALCGEFEGNCLSISSYSINTNDTLVNGGLFAQIGSEKSRASVKNLVLLPKYINMPNVSVVGTLAGTVMNASVINVSVSASQMLVGKHIVGGVIGRASNNYHLYNLNSNISVSASSLNGGFEDKILYSVQKDSKLDNFSYAGGVVGVLGNDKGMAHENSDCNAYYLNVSSPITIIGKVIGVVSAGVVDNANLYNSDVEISNEYTLKAYAYGGYVAGHVRGNIINCNVNETKDKERTESFKNEPIIAKGIGGIAGIVQDDANIKNCSVNANILSSKVASVGGIVGYLYSKEETAVCNIENCQVNGNVKGVSAVGGVIGLMADYHTNVNEIFFDSTYENDVNLGKLVIKNLKLENIEVIVDNSKAYTESSINYGSAGVIIGVYYGKNNNVELNTDTLTIDIDLKTNIYSIATNINAYLGSIAGYYTTAFSGEIDSSKVNEAFNYKFIKSGEISKFSDMVKVA